MLESIDIYQRLAFDPRTELQNSPDGKFTTALAGFGFWFAVFSPLFAPDCNEMKIFKFSRLGVNDRTNASGFGVQFARGFRRKRLAF